jgi:hypothetical protein
MSSHRFHPTAVLIKTMPYDYAVLDGTTKYNYSFDEIPIEVLGPDDETRNLFSPPTS